MSDKQNDTAVHIPQDKLQRSQLTSAVRNYIQREKPVCPLGVDQLRFHAERICDEASVSADFINYVIILVSNELWRNTVAAIPYNRRLLLLPKCLRDQNLCPAQFDEIGLLCEHCGRCPIGKLKAQAEKLGYAVLIAEGSPVVMSLIETGKVEAIIGVSCLSVLERAFPYMEAGAVPGIAIPLLRDGCMNTSVDLDTVWEAIYENAEDSGWRLNLTDLQKEVEAWFATDSLEDAMGLTRNKKKRQVEELAVKWLSKAGKRWRPFLAAAVHQAIVESDSTELRKVGIAVECFHKASLIHDDIEDGDDLRYGEKTLHAEYGVPIALNVGDFLLGEGYRILAECNVSGQCKARMLQIAAEGHRNLCLGQGDELAWMRQARPLSSDEVIEIFAKKTAPAFEVALKLGATLADQNKLDTAIEQYSRALGIAYQIRDDIDDFHNCPQIEGSDNMRPSLLLALAWQAADEQDRSELEPIWNNSANSDATLAKIRDIVKHCGIEKQALEMLEEQKMQALAALNLFDNTSLKSLLRRIICKIFDDVEIVGCCNDHKQEH